MDEAAIRSYLPDDLALYSLSDEVVYRTASDGSSSFVELICDDLAYSNVVGYLKHHGTPALDPASHEAYLTALEAGLRQGLSPQAARQEAIRTIKVD